MDILFIYPAESEGFLRNPNKLPLAPCSKKKERFACLSKLRQTNRPFFFAESEGFENCHRQ